MTELFVLGLHLNMHNCNWQVSKYILETMMDIQSFVTVRPCMCGIFGRVKQDPH